MCGRIFITTSNVCIPLIHRNMNEMWSEMSESCREEYRDYFIAYHNGVAKTGITGKRIKPVTVLPRNVIKGFEKALLVKVNNFFSPFGIFS